MSHAQYVTRRDHGYRFDQRVRCEQGVGRVTYVGKVYVWVKVRGTVRRVHPTRLSAM